MIEINDKTGPNDVKKGKIILMFYTNWCPKCPPIINELTKLEKKYKRNKNKKFTFAKIDYDKNPEAVEFFNIPGVPAIMQIKDKEILQVWVGIETMGVCENAVNELINLK
jgi:thiol-disulfide isomerase/thioredoxin